MAKEHNNFVKEQITTTLLKLLETNSLSELNISDITKAALVSRMSFYRNFSSKEDILKQHSVFLTKQWGEEFENTPGYGIHNVFGSLFEHFANNQDFYKLLYRENLSTLILDTILEISGPKPDMSNKEAYEKAFFAYGLYGWIDEWIARGMQESPEEINQLLNLK
ncbi:TetR/AcrR family transcriptional regulator [Paenibacillus peoriae]|uniref:TetR/AcrR family transcriptional regulator n=1 Tax=Paenibacillus peoriae TaxID=59893 RepID=UPI000CEC24BD|nr:TetR/AcrR family transcriptional regulator [Paenibacillus peoriae]PPQ49283.1 TetR/AcrR family transcriptional regulator [Paenibacillus peoriae]